MKTPLEPGQHEISKDIARAICGGSRRLMPEKGQTKGQPQDSTGKYLIGQTSDGRYFTQEKP